MRSPRQQSQPVLDRRSFVAGVSAASLVAAAPALAKTYQENAKLELGLIGCGNRGKWIAKLFQDTGNYRWVASRTTIRTVLTRWDSSLVSPKTAASADSPVTSVCWTANWTRS